MQLGHGRSDQEEALSHDALDLSLTEQIEFSNLTYQEHARHRAAGSHAADTFRPLAVAEERLLDRPFALSVLFAWLAILGVIVVAFTVSGCQAADGAKPTPSPGPAVAHS